MSIKKFDYGDEKNSECIKYFQFDEDQEKKKTLTIEEKRRIEKDYKRLVTASTEKLYLIGAIVSLVILRLLNLHVALIVIIPAIFILGYYLTMKYNKQKLEKYKQDLGYEPELQISKLSKLYNRFTKGV